MDTASRPEPASGTIIGRYVVLSKLGAGGMGVVMAAYDPELDRKVALKLLATPSGDQEASARLKREAQALAKLEHPNVVSVYDVGVHDGQIFIGMEFVQGQTLREWLALPRAWREVVRVFAAAGRGLAAAHEAGLVHRDFKPDNVMLGVDGRARVMDFGLARASDIDEGELDPALATLRSQSGDETLRGLTQTGALVGTPAYMALERYEGVAADARSDQFSFCVALYEALYRVRPFRGGSMAELIDAIESKRIAEAATRTQVPAWLRKVVVRGLEPERDARWPSMAALLDALADDPARRRRRAWATMLGLSLALGVASWGWQAREREALACGGMAARLDGIWDAGRRADVRAAIERTELSYARDTWVQVEQQLDAYALQWVAARVDSCEATRNGEQSGELLDLRMACLDERRSHLRAMVDVLAHADATVVEKAVSAVSHLPGIARCADLAALQAEQPPPDDPQLAAQVVQLDALLIEIHALERAGKHEQALARYEARRDELEAIAYPPVQVRAWLRRGAIESAAGDYETAQTSLERAYELAIEQRMIAAAAEAAHQLMLVIGHHLGHFEQGRWWARHSRALALASGTSEAWTAHLNDLGIVAESEGKHEEARGLHEQALAIRMRELGPEHLDVALSLNNLGIVTEQEGRYDEAREQHERALVLREQLLGPDHLHVAHSLTNLGNVAWRQGEYDESRVHQERALAIKERALGPEHPELAITLNSLGIVADVQGRLDEAARHHRRALAIWERALGPDHPHVAHALCNLGIVAREQGNHDEARAHLERALAIKEKAAGPNHPDVATILCNLADVAMVQQRFDDALRDFERALAITRASLDDEHPAVVFPLLGVGRALLGQGHEDAALAPLEQALTRALAVDADPALRGDVRFALARALWDAAADSGRDRGRAGALARLARDDYALADAREAVAEVDAWLATHE